MPFMNTLFSRKDLIRASSSLFFSFFKVKISAHLLDYENANSEAKKDDKNDPNEGGPSSGQANQAQLGVSDLFKNPFVRKVTIIMFFNWIVVTLGNIFCRNY